MTEDKLTNHEIAKVVSMYYGAKVLRHNDWEKGSVDFLTAHYLQYAETTGLLYVQLLLTDLKDITDEHAIEVAKSFYGLCFNNNCKTGWVVERDKIYPNEFLNISHKNNDYSFNFDLVGGNVTLYRMEEYDSGGSHVNAIDKFREFGYALLYKGKSLFELQIAISK